MNSKVDKKTPLVLFLAVSFVVISFIFQHFKAKELQREIKVRNAYVVLMPLIELCGESGSTYEVAITSHYKLVTRSIDAVKNYKLPLLARAFYPMPNKINLKKLRVIQDELDWKPSSAVLSDADKEDARKRVENAQKLAGVYLKKLKEMSSSPIVIERQKGIPVEIRDGVEAALINCHNEVEKYINIFMNKSATEAQRIKNAEDVCDVSRSAIALSVIGSLVYEDFITDEQLLEFRKDINRIIHINGMLLKSIAPKTNAYQKIVLYTESEVRRLAILNALMRKDDLQKAQKLLINAMDEAISKCSDKS